MLQVLIQNAFLLITLSFLYGTLRIYLSKYKLLFQVSSGIWFGLVAMAAMMIPYEYEPGIIFDGRSVVITLAGLWGGWLTTLISALIAGAYRISLGGAGVLAGTATILFCGLTGLIFHHFFYKRLERIHTLVLAGIGVITHFVMLGSQLLIPQHALRVIEAIWMPILLVFPVAFTIIAKLFQFIGRYIQNEQQVRRAEEIYRTTLMSIGDAVIGADKNGNVSQINPEAERLTGWKANEAIGKPLEDIFCIINEYTRETVENPFTKVMQSGMIVGLANHTLLISKNKDEIPIADSGAPIRNNNEITGVVLVFRDQTEERKHQRELEESEARYREREYWLSESQQIGKIGSYKLNTLNDQWTSSDALDHIFGIDEKYPRTVESWNSIVHPDHQKEMLDYFLNKVINQKQAFEKEYKITRVNDGAERWVFGRGELRFNHEGNPVEMIGTIQDTTERKIFEQQLLESEERFRKVVLMAPIPIMVYDEDGKVLHVSEGWTHFSGYSINEIPTLEIWEQKAYMGEGKEKKGKVVSNLSESKTIYSGEYKITTKNGNIRIWNYYTTELGVSGGKKITLIIAPDVTQRIRMKNDLEESERAYRLLFEDHIAIKLLVDPTNRQIIKANRAASEYYGWSIEELENMKLDQINIVPSEKLRSDMNLAANHYRIYFEFKHRLAGGEIRDVEIFTSMTDYKGKEVLHCIIHDITDKKQLLNDLIAAKEKAEESERLKSAFLANVSHEIRTPLHGIVGFSDILAQNDDLTMEKKREFATIINKSSEGLIKIINDILDISRLETGKTVIDSRPFDVNLMLQNIYSIFRNRFPQTDGSNPNLKLKNSNEPLMINADEGRITQIFSNLLDNAFRFTKEGIISFGISGVSEKQIDFFVSDTGIGIAREKQEEIFGRFVQAESGTWRSYGGTGLGLAIVKKLLELMGSEIRLESEIGKGTIFRFSLPVYKLDYTGDIQIEEQHVIKENQKEKNKSVKKILVVDDDETSRSYLFQVLSDIYPNLLFAETGMQALKLVETESPDVILLDIGLPDISGIDVAIKIRESNRNIRIIAQTAYAMAEDEKSAREAGCDDFITKPLDISKLLEKLQIH